MLSSRQLYVIVTSFVPSNTLQIHVLQAIASWFVANPPAGSAWSRSGAARCCPAGGPPGWSWGLRRQSHRATGNRRRRRQRAQGQSPQWQSAVELRESPRAAVEVGESGMSTSMMNGGASPNTEPKRATRQQSLTILQNRAKKMQV
jgi:hypothetical protein